MGRSSIPEEVGHPRHAASLWRGYYVAERAGSTLCPSAIAPARLGSVGRAGGALARPAPRAVLSCFANPAWHLPQLPAASREQGTN